MEERLASVTEEEEYREFKKARREEEARANVLKIECDLLSPFIDRATLKEQCKAANSIGLGALVVFPSVVKSCAAFLGKDPETALIAAVDFPLGEETTEIKVASVKRAVKDGVDEVEVCAPLAFIREGNFSYFKKECKKIKKAARGRAVRIVFDCSALAVKELMRAVQVAADAGVNCVRLNGGDSETVVTVKTALKGKCLIKAEGAETLSAFTNLCAMGADAVSCKNAASLASLILKAASE